MNRMALTLMTFSLAVAGCAAPTDSESPEATATSEAEIASVREPAIEANASYRMVSVGTPTYGYDPRAPFLRIEVTVEDAVLRARLPGFDGLERAFALVPRSDGAAGARWERVELGSRGVRLRGYYGDRRLDVHDIENMRISDADLALVEIHGIAIGLDTNRGVVWAQDSGKNFQVTQTR